MDEPVRQAVLGWGLARLRDLPWRRTRDPWLVLVSEVMLQQTQVDRVIPKWTGFIEQYPSAQACAQASLGDVLRMWHGLGYPRRAQNLHRSAQIITDAGRFPETLEELLKLPGVGAYTARAVLAFAFERDAAVVETNVARVFARYVGSTLTPSDVQRQADAALVVGESWAWNQTLMDLGAALCRPRNPHCELCPLVSSCVWHGDGVDPALGSAGVSGAQSRFDGSDRQGRGRLLRRLGHAPLQVDAVAATMGWPDQPVRADRVSAALVAEGLVVSDAGWLRLP